MPDIENQVGESPLVAELRARLERLQTLYQVSDTIHSTLEPQHALELIVREAVRLMRASSGSVVLVNPTTGFLEIQAAHGLPPQSLALKLRVGEGITGWVARRGKALRVGDVTKDERYIMVNQEVRSELAVPLEVSGELRGVINVDSNRLNAFSEADEQLLRDFARQASRVVENTWRFEQSRLKAKLFESLISVSQAINSSLSLDETLRVITREACVLMNGKMCSLMMLDETRDWLELCASYGAGDAYVNKPRLSVSESLLGVVVRRKKPHQVENVQVSGRYQNIEIARREGLVSLLSVPLVYAGRAMGALSVYTGEFHSFSNEEIRILTALAELSGVAIEKAKSHERLVDMEERLLQNEKLSAIGLLAAEVAHEIRNPLTVIKMLYHSLELQFPPDDPRARDVEIMGERMDHLNKIVEQVLHFARTAEPNFEQVNVNQLLEDLALLIRHKLANQQIELVRQLQPTLPPVWGDATQLGQAFLNLVLNAIEAMPEGGNLIIGTRAGAGSDGGRIYIEFADTGCGMSDEQKTNVFRSILQTTKKTGTGLGLALVGKIVDAHGGEIKVSSRQGKGTTFRIVLPIKEKKLESAAG
jgi:signal transduction histidine kinase